MIGKFMIDKSVGKEDNDDTNGVFQEFFGHDEPGFVSQIYQV